MTTIPEAGGQARDIWSEQEIYQGLFESSPDAILLLDNKCIADCNPAAEEMLLSRRKDLLKKSIFDLFPEKQPSGEASRQAVEMALGDCSHRGLQICEWQTLLGDGSPLT